MKIWIPALAVVLLLGCRKDAEPPASAASVGTSEEPDVEVEDLDPREDPETRETKRGPEDPAGGERPAAGRLRGFLSAK